MPVSDEWKNLRFFLMKTHNNAVREWFKDDNDPLPDNSTGRKQAKRACLIKPTDSQNMALLKIHNFMYIVQRVQHKPDVFGMPVGALEAQRKYRPQVVLEFLEDEKDVELGYSRVDGRISFRLMDETSESISKTRLISLANRIKDIFGAGDGLVWKKGKDMATYTNWSQGYQLQLLVRNKTEAKALIRDVLNIQNHAPNWAKLNYKENEDPTEAFPTIPGKTTIMGKTYNEPRKRPIADVRFTHAYCSLSGRPRPVIMYDRSFMFIETLVSR